MTIDQTFGSVADGYRSFRPHYPDALFDFLAHGAPAREAAWDVGCGSGQASVALAARFDRVLATDASDAQLAHAPPHPRIDYRVARAEASGLPDRCVDLVTAAQAAHWFDHEAFTAEVRRVSRPGAVVALFGYGLMHIAPELDAIIEHLYFDTVGRYWPPERHYIDAGYRTLPFAFAELDAPDFEITALWSAEQTLGYLRTWSAVVRCRDAEGRDPVDPIAAPLTAAWGPGERTVRWPVMIRVGRA